MTWAQLQAAYQAYLSGPPDSLYRFVSFDTFVEEAVAERKIPIANIPPEYVERLRLQPTVTRYQTWDQFIENFFMEYGGRPSNLPIATAIGRLGLTHTAFDNIQAALRSQTLRLNDVPAEIRLELGIIYKNPQLPEHLLTNLQIASKYPQLLAKIIDIWNGMDDRRVPMVHGTTARTYLLAEVVRNQTNSAQGINASQLGSPPLSAEVINVFHLTPDQITQSLNEIRFSISPQRPIPGIIGRPIQSRPTISLDLTFDQLMHEFRNSSRAININLNVTHEIGSNGVVPTGYISTDTIASDRAFSSALRDFISDAAIRGRFLLSNMPPHMRQNENLRYESEEELSRVDGLTEEQIRINHARLRITRDLVLDWEDGINENGGRVRGFLSRHFNDQIPITDLTATQRTNLRNAILNQLFQNSEFIRKVPPGVIESLNIVDPATIPPFRGELLNYCQGRRNDLLRIEDQIPRITLRIEGEIAVVGTARIPLEQMRRLNSVQFQQMLDVFDLEPANTNLLRRLVGPLRPAPGVSLPRLISRLPASVQLPNVNALRVVQGQTALTRVTNPIPSNNICRDIPIIRIPNRGDRLNIREAGTSNSRINALGPIFAGLAAQDFGNRTEAYNAALIQLSQRFGMTVERIHEEWLEFLNQRRTRFELLPIAIVGAGRPRMSTTNRGYVPLAERTLEERALTEFFHVGAYIELMPEFETRLQTLYPLNRRRIDTPEAFPRFVPQECLAQSTNQMGRAYISPQGRRQILGGQIRNLDLTRDELSTATFNRTNSYIEQNLRADPIVHTVYTFSPITRFRPILQRFLGSGYTNFEQQQNEIVDLAKGFERFKLAVPNLAPSLQVPAIQMMDDLAERFQTNLVSYNDKINDTGMLISEEQFRTNFSTNEQTLSAALSEFNQLLELFNLNDLPALPTAVPFDDFLRAG